MCAVFYQNMHVTQGDTRPPQHHTYMYLGAGGAGPLFEKYCHANTNEISRPAIQPSKHLGKTTPLPNLFHGHLCRDKEPPIHLNPSPPHTLTTLLLLEGCVLYATVTKS